MPTPRKALPELIHFSPRLWGLDMNYKELIEQLRYGSLCPVSGDGCEDKLKAADAIESLLAENERLKAELAKYRDAPVVAWSHLVKGLTFVETYAGSKPLIVKPGE